MFFVHDVVFEVVPLITALRPPGAPKEATKKATAQTRATDEETMHFPDTAVTMIPGWPHDHNVHEKRTRKDVKRKCFEQ